ncbi:unnamed protein product [Zymoseptoria tritici ST99CH_1A5]|uniref:Membrane protein n=5 Tax=Zymoseptoria TaxID=1047167 RepID=A0A0F4GVI4_9PEZI|nr:uncharacterized protein MYCGRDRAFT_72047 [Zymoseptoria tritici IPO323]KJY00231.1 membrane protein [Zymoseptoria brevis]SMQ50792.1 unnamed protein product [Zymoseptoria tritici ST99CH_3D7]SMR52707.1 unnamed protein product [Zymoseptoria tritici ST99CH_1E4]SMR53961.1 unnamed protein product [Zymoseptoria tritici ST99CH_3D1]SMY24458.1 unnamed protein product [Zymoseptoria tritici ST99CH_1A5]
MSAALGLRQPLLRPVIALAGWTFIMQGWMYAKRLPALSNPDYGCSMEAGEIAHDMNTKLPIEVRQVADNYNHLHEQPTVFYAVALALSAIGDTHDYTIYGAWGYVGLRVVHSLFQSLVNKVMTRFQIFSLSSVVLASLTARAARLLF